MHLLSPIPLVSFLPFSNRFFIGLKTSTADNIIGNKLIVFLKLLFAIKKVAFYGSKSAILDMLKCHFTIAKCIVRFVNIMSGIFYDNYSRS